MADKKLPLDRYLARIKAMQSMIADSSSMGAGDVAASKLEQELEKYEEYGFASKEAVLAALDVDGDTFDSTVFDFMQLTIGKRIPQWKKTLALGCAYQCQCYVSYGRGTFRFYGPIERLKLTIWLFNQLEEDISRNSEAAYRSLDSRVKVAENKRAFKNSYNLAVASMFAQKEVDKRNARMAASPPAQKVAGSALVVVGGQIDKASESFANSRYKLKSGGNLSYYVSSAAGASAGIAEADKVSNRRVTGSSRRLGGS